MTQVLHIHGTVVMYAPITEGDRLSRRERERRAVAEIVRRHAGEDARIEHDAHGAPVLSGWRVSVSHSKRLAVVAFDPDTPVGVDAEEWRPALYKVASRYLTEAEAQWCTSAEQLLRAWTIKEAVFKAASLPDLELQDISISPDMATATAAGCTYSLHCFSAGDTAITLAKPQALPISKLSQKRPYL